MRLGKVKANITSTIKNPYLTGEKIMVVEIINPDGTGTGKEVVAIEKAQAGIGDIVLLMDEGGSARMVLGKDRAPVRAVIVGVVDAINLKKEV